MRTATRSQFVRLVTGIVLATMISGNVFAGAQSSPLDWEAVRAIPVETKVRLTFLDGAAAEGVLVAVGADELLLRDTLPLKGKFLSRDVSGQQAFSRQNLAKVEPQVKQKVSSSQKTAIWVAVAAGVAAAVIIPATQGFYAH